MASDFKGYISALSQEILPAFRRGVVVVTVLAYIVPVGAYILLGWHLSFSTFQISTGALAIAVAEVLIVLPYRLWGSNTAKIRELQESLRPKLKCSFDMNDPGCVRPNTNIMVLDSGGTAGSSSIATLYRIKVEAGGGVAQFGSARLLSVKRADSELLLGEAPSLAFAPESDGLAKLIHPGIPEYVNFLWTNQTDGAQIPIVGPRSSAVRWGTLFEIPGDHTISIGITHGPTTRIDLKFGWTLDPITSRITVMAS